VLEKNKINAFSLGQSLWIGNEEFEDLDEIIARHINPMASHARDLLNFKYYSDSQGGKREVAEEKLRLEKRAHPGKIHYFIAASKELPGKFMLSYMPRGKARHEYVTVLLMGSASVSKPLTACLTYSNGLKSISETQFLEPQ